MTVLAPGLYVVNTNPRRDLRYVLALSEMADNFEDDQDAVYRRRVSAAWQMRQVEREYATP